MTLAEFLLWLLGSGGLGWLSYKLLSWLDVVWIWFQTLRGDWKRVLSFVIAGGVGAGVGALAILLSAWMGYEAAPVTPQLWVERLFALAAASIVASQVTHGARELHGQKRQ